MHGLIDYWIFSEGASYLAFVGFLATIAGFAWTIRVAQASRSAAEQANSAVTKVREDLRRLDVVSNLSTAISFMEEIMRLHRENAWAVMPDRYFILKRLLVEIRSSGSIFSVHHQKTIQSTVSHLSTMEEQIERYLKLRIEHDDNIDFPDYTEFNRIVSKQSLELVEIKESLRNGVGSVPYE